MFEFSNPTLAVGVISALISGASVKVTMTNQQRRLPDLVPTLIRTSGGQVRLRLVFVPGGSDYRFVSVRVKNCQISSEFEMNQYDGTSVVPLLVDRFGGAVEWVDSADVDVVIRAANCYAAFKDGNRRLDQFIWVDFLIKPMTSMNAIDVVVIPPLIDRLKLKTWPLKSHLPLYEWIFP